MKSVEMLLVVIVVMLELLADDKLYDVIFLLFLITDLHTFCHQTFNLTN